MVTARKTGRNYIITTILIFLILIVLFFYFFKNKPKVIEKELPFSVIELGNITIKDRGNYVINSREELDELLNKSMYGFRQMKLNNNLDLAISLETLTPEIDLEKYTIIAVFMGELPTSGYSINIDKIIEEKKDVKVFLTETMPGKDCQVNQVFTYPYQVVKVPKISKIVDFIYNKVVEDCN
jgi:hypothetical protein